MRLEEILEISDHSKMLRAIREYLNSVDMTVEEAVEQLQNKKIAEIIKNNFEKIKELKVGKKNYLSEKNFNDSLSEEEASSKYTSKNSKVTKGTSMIASAIKQGISKKFSNSDICYDRLYYVSSSISECILNRHTADFPKVIRTKVHNLKENEDLSFNVYLGDVNFEIFVGMTAEEMKSKNQKSEDEKILIDSINASKTAQPMAETDMFQCSKCKQRKCSYSQLQTRSCDEPMTTFVHCSVCGNRWKF